MHIYSTLQWGHGKVYISFDIHKLLQSFLIVNLISLFWSSVESVFKLMLDIKNSNNYDS